VRRRWNLYLCLLPLLLDQVVLLPLTQAQRLVLTIPFDFSKKTIHSNRESPGWMTTDICSGSDAGSPQVPLSPVDEVPRPPQAKQSILYDVHKSPSTKQSILHRTLLRSPHRGKPGLKSPSQQGKSPMKLFASPSRRGQYLHEQMSQKHIPYAFHPAPLELRFAACFSSWAVPTRANVSETYSICFPSGSTGASICSLCIRARI
jgi:hypothetical protein